MAVPNLNFTLYPPIVDTYMPAFINDDACTVYFSLSSYNSLEDISGLQFTVKRQANNVTALRDGKQMITLGVDKIQKTLNEMGEIQYSFVINSSLIQNGKFDINTYYKVQVRFIDKLVTTLPSDENIDAWNKDHLSNLSEWSTACLIRGILKPDIYLQNFDTERDTAIASGKQTYLSAPQVLDIVGRMFFNDAQEKRIEGENLKSYRIRIWQADNMKVGEELDDSGIIYVDQFSNENRINYSIKYNFTTGESYVLIIDCETNNLFTFSKKYSFKIKNSILGILKGKLSLDTDDEAGAVKLKFLSEEDYYGNITIRRTSSETGFQVWEDVKTEIADLKIGSLITISDYTIKSGIFYKYAIQKRSSNGLRGDLNIATKKIEKKDIDGNLILDEDGNIVMEEVDDVKMIVFDDIFLTRQNKQLRIEFDPQISSFGYQTSEAKTDTIGSQFPFIRRNGKLKYREFPISGQVTHLSNIYNFLVDGEQKREDSCGTIEKDYFQQKTLLTDKETYYNNYKLRGKGERYDIAKLYEDYNSENNITDYNDYIWERDFREAVMDFLHEDTVKLFRSTTEGNILVKLTNISFTPNQQLGRLIYNFSATATEIAEPSFNNYKDYGIISTGDISSIVNNLKEEMISLTLNLKKSTPTPEEKEAWDLDTRPSDVITAINQYLNKEQVRGEFITYSIQELKWLRLEFQTPTHRIAFDENSGEPIIVSSELESSLSAPTNSALAYGYIAIINGKNRFINKNGYYEITDDEDLNISSLSFPTDETITITCSVVKGEGENTEQMERIEYTYDKVAQIDSRLRVNQDFIQDIKDKYNILEQDFEQYVLDISTLDIEAPVGSIFYLQCDGGEYMRHIIGKTGRLRLEESGYNFTSAYYGGVLLHKSDSSQVEDGEYFDSGKNLLDKNEEYLHKENQFYSTEGQEKYFITVYNPDIREITNEIIVGFNDVIPSVRVGYSLVMIPSEQHNFITYHGVNRPVIEDDINKETGDIQFYPQVDALITFKCNITGKES